MPVQQPLVRFLGRDPTGPEHPPPGYTRPRRRRHRRRRASPRHFPHDLHLGRDLWRGALLVVKRPLSRAILVIRYPLGTVPEPPVAVIPGGVITVVIIRLPAGWVLARRYCLSGHALDGYEENDAVHFHRSRFPAPPWASISRRAPPYPSPAAIAAPCPATGRPRALGPEPSALPASAVLPDRLPCPFSVLFTIMYVYAIIPSQPRRHRFGHLPGEVLPVVVVPHDR